MVTPQTARTIVGVVGNIISLGIFLSPVPTIYEIIKKKSLEENKPHSYISTTLSCMCWTLYGMPFVQPDRILVATCHGIGLVLGLIYLAIIFAYSDEHDRKTIRLHLAGQVLFAVVLITMVASHDGTFRLVFVGFICFLLSLILKCCLSCVIMGIVVGTKDLEYMSFTLLLINFFNDCVWTAYANFDKLDIFILFSNGPGAFIGFYQLVFYACYCRIPSSNN